MDRKKVAAPLAPQGSHRKDRKDCKNRKDCKEVAAPLAPQGSHRKVTAPLAPQGVHRIAIRCGEGTLETPLAPLKTTN